MWTRKSLMIILGKKHGQYFHGVKHKRNLLTQHGNCSNLQRLGKKVLWVVCQSGSNIPQELSSALRGPGSPPLQSTCPGAASSETGAVDCFEG